MKLPLGHAIVSSVLLATQPMLPAAESSKTERVVLVGDSTVASRSGWGDSFGTMLKPEVSWVNFGRGGRSSKSYRTEGWWEKALAGKPTWVFIQFGHNDQPGKGPERETDPDTTFRENLARYVREARDAGARPVIFTSLTRRNFNAAGKIDPRRLESATDGSGEKRTDNLSDYAEGARAVARELGAPLIDLNKLSIEQMNRFGPEAAKRFDPRVRPPAFPDKTHLSKYGAQQTAGLVAAELRRVVPEFEALLQSVSRPGAPREDRAE